VASVLLALSSESLSPVAELEVLSTSESEGSLVPDDHVVPLHLNNLDDGDRLLGDLLLGTHFGIEFAQSGLETWSSEFLKSIDLTGSGSVSEVDTVVLGSEGVSLGNSLDSQNFTLAGLELVEVLVKLPALQKSYQNWDFAKFSFLAKTLKQTT